MIYCFNFSKVLSNFTWDSGQSPSYLYSPSVASRYGGLLRNGNSVVRCCRGSTFHLQQLTAIPRESDSCPMGACQAQCAFQEETPGAITSCQRDPL